MLNSEWNFWWNKVFILARFYSALELYFCSQEINVSTMRHPLQANKFGGFKTEHRKPNTLAKLFIKAKIHLSLKGSCYPFSKFWLWLKGSRNQFSKIRLPFYRSQYWNWKFGFGFLSSKPRVLCSLLEKSCGSVPTSKT